jgi:hypothetical protein
MSPENTRDVERRPACRKRGGKSFPGALRWGRISLADPIALVDIDGAPRAAVEALVEEARRVLEGGARARSASGHGSSPGCALDS